jgi:hypothetical protein
MTMMTQCRLVRNGSTQVAWIDASLASPGRRVDIRVDGVWDRGWEVAEAYNSMDSRTVAARERDFKNHRKATDFL